jgi:hypothetical protein
VRWAEHVARIGEIRNTCNILVEKPERKRGIILKCILEK